MDVLTIRTGVVERGAKVPQFDVCYKAIGQNFDCGCDRYTFGLASHSFDILTHESKTNLDYVKV